MHFKHLLPKTIFVCLSMVFAFALYAQQPAAHAAPEKPAAQKAAGATFAPVNKRDPFLSREEVGTIEQARLAEIKRREAERKRIEEEERARLAELERQRLLEEELAKNPARAVINRIRIDGIVGAEAIVNGDFKAVGDSVLGAKITKVSDSSVTFVYQGQTFVKKLPVAAGVGIL